MEERKFGSFYIGGKVSEPHVDCQLSQVTAISLGDTVPGKELKWVESEGFWVADTEVCLNISWQQLNYIGYIFGHPVKIDGRLFLCRSPKISRKPGKPKEHPFTTFGCRRPSGARVLCDMHVSLSWHKR